MQYRAASRLWKMAVSWVRSQLPLPMRPSGSAQPGPGGGWTPGEIAGLVTAITAALVGLGEATRRGVKTVRRHMAEKDAELDAARSETDEAMQALDEVKEVHPDAVKAAAETGRSARTCAGHTSDGKVEQMLLPSSRRIHAVLAGQGLPRLDALFPLLGENPHPRRKVSRRFPYLHKCHPREVLDV